MCLGNTPINFYPREAGWISFSLPERNIIRDVAINRLDDKKHDEGSSVLAQLHPSAE